MSDPNINAQALQDAFLGGVSRVKVVFFKNDIDPNETTQLSDLVLQDKIRLDSRSAGSWEQPVIERAGVATVSSRTQMLVRSTGGDAAEVATGYALVGKPIAGGPEFVLNARRFGEPLTFKAKGDSLAMSVDVSALKDPTPSTDRVLYTSKVRIKHGGRRLSKVQRAELRILRQEIRRLGESEAKGVEAADRTGKGFVPAIGDDQTAYLTEVVLARINELLS